MGKSLLQQISELKEQKVDYDIEDNDLKQVFSDDDQLSDEEVINDHYVDVPKSKLRQKTDNLNLGSKYTGSVTSRNELYNEDQSEEEDEEEDEDDEDDDEDDDEEEEDDDLPNGKVEKGEEDDNLSSDSVDLDDVELQSESSDEDLLDENSNLELDHQRSKLKQLINSERKHIVNRLSQSATNDSLKGYAIQQQHKFFDKLIDSRLKLQKSLINSNQLPVSHSCLKSINEKISKKSLDNIKQSCYDLVDSIFKLRNQLLISDSIAKKEVALPKKRSFDQYLSTTNKFDEYLEKYRHEILIKWSGKVQNSSGANALNNGKFKAINQSFDQQVDNNLHDMERLIKRTKLNRRQITPLGYRNEQEEEEQQQQQLEEVEESNLDIPVEKPKQSGEISEIFDDDDFYRVLLNDLVDKKIQSSNPTTGLTMVNLKSAQKVQKLNKNVDTKASKGRKLKYSIQEPIANLEVPRNGWKWDDNQIDEFFASLLGQRVNMNEQEEDNNEENEEITVNQDSIKLFG